jgi:hypothetical protein
MRSKVRAYSHQGHGPRADQQAGYISATSASSPPLRNAAGPYIWVRNCHSTPSSAMSALRGGFNGSLQHRAQSFGGAFEAQNLSRTLVRFKDDWLSCGVTRRSIAHPQYRGSCKSDASCATAHTRGRLSRVHTARATQSRFGGSPAIHQHWVLIFPSVGRSMRRYKDSSL